MLRGAQVAILSTVVREGLTDEVIFEQKLGDQRNSLGDTWEKNTAFKSLSEFQNPSRLISPQIRNCNLAFLDTIMSTNLVYGDVFLTTFY